VATTVAVSDRPSVHLTPAGVAVRQGRTRRHVDWAGIAVDGADVDDVERPRYVTIVLAEAPVAGRFAPTVDIKLTYLAADPAELAAAINQYVANPEHRPAIGTVTELDRLRATLAPPSTPVIA
jgi:hypothetical protein